jgi:hypothetical protein
MKPHGVQSGRGSPGVKRRPPNANRSRTRACGLTFLIFLVLEISRLCTQANTSALGDTGTGLDCFWSSSIQGIVLREALAYEAAAWERPMPATAKTTDLLSAHIVALRQPSQNYRDAGNGDDRAVRM